MEEICQSEQEENEKQPLKYMQTYSQSRYFWKAKGELLYLDGGLKLNFRLNARIITFYTTPAFAMNRNHEGNEAAS